MRYPRYVPDWYDPKVSYMIMQKHGDKSEELKTYMECGRYEDTIL